MTPALTRLLVQFVPGTSPIPALTCPYAPGLELPFTRSIAMGLGPARRPDACAAPAWPRPASRPVPVPRYWCNMRASLN
jgi:hypothetical protein